MTEREILQREIASILDYPSVYMGGPSYTSLQKAERIVKFLERRAAGESARSKEE